EAIDVLLLTDEATRSPLVDYYLAFYMHKINSPKSAFYLQRAAAGDPYLCYPNRLQDIAALEFVRVQNTTDHLPPYYLGNLWYDKRQYSDAIAAWELSVERYPDFPTVHRNLGIAYFNKQNELDKAIQSFEMAFVLDKTDARILMELDQLYKRVNR